MYRPALLRGASACALILASLTTAKAQVSLPQIVVGAAQRAPTTPPLEKADETVVTQKEIIEEKPPETDTAKLLGISRASAFRPAAAFRASRRSVVSPTIA
ncbi:hypothetical protein [Methylocystis sp.]|uniref:hypothetical protein n=1 Tax=Methylocystis sp. TaxID=1911079 RepID=UPI003DA49C1B